MNNKYFNDLLIAIKGTAEIEEDQFIKALYLLRAHYHLAGIIIICQRLINFVKADELGGFEEFTDELQILKKISQLDSQKFQYFYDQSTKKNKHNPTPLRPYTGDSGICDLLLIQPIVKENSEEFDRVLTWFLLQIFYFQKAVHDLESYRTYLTGDGQAKLKAQKGSRVYGAFLAIRSLADEKYQDTLRIISKLVITYSSFALITEMQKYMQELQKNSDPLDKAKISIFYSLQLFLCQIWRRSELNDRKKRSKFINGIQRKHQQLDLKRYGKSYIAMQHLEDADGIHTGLISEIYTDVVFDDDDVETPLAPLLVFFLAEKKCLIRGLYAAKSALQHIEAANVGLPWVKWRLSKTSIDALLELCQCNSNDGSLVLRAKLALLLSLLTGRSVFDLSAPYFTSNLNDPKLKKKVGIVRHLNILSVPAGTPHLKKKPNVSKFSTPWTATLHLVLPTETHDLIERVADLNITTQQVAVEKSAKHLLNQLPNHLELGLKSIREMLLRVLYEKSQGDLAVVKAITDISGRNYESLIHYASFEKEYLEDLWRRSLIKIGLDITTPRVPSVHYLPTRVGCPIGIEKQPLRSAIHELKKQIQQAIQQECWFELLNHMTVYTILWMNLATAGRGIKQPFPEFISQDGWTLIQDKHHRDESTDRYVPLNPALIKQIQILRALMKMFGGSNQLISQAVDPSTYRLKPLIDFQNFHPKQIENIETLKGLVRNWARKLIRSEINDLPGRFKDAGLGHWVSGRHPWQRNSTFPAEDFKQSWLYMQENLQAKLGFESLSLGEIITPPTYLLPIKPKMVAMPAPIEYSVQDVKRWLLNKEYQDYCHLVFNRSSEPQVALELAHKLIEDLSKDQQVNLPQAAKKFCAYVRDETQIPLFVQLPQQSDRTWLTSKHAFSSWCYVEQVLLAKIDQDLEKLPNQHNESCEVAIGRLLVVFSRFSQLYRISHLQAMLQFMASDRCVIAMGDTRFIELEVNNDRSQSKVRRTIMLCPYVSTLLLVDRSFVQARLKQAFSQTKSQQLAYWSKCFKQYLSAIGVKSLISLNQWLKALQQNLMLKTTPLLAGYAAGQVLTEDLSINEILRLSGYEAINALQINHVVNVDSDVVFEQEMLSELLNQIEFLKKSKEKQADIWIEIFKYTDLDSRTTSLLKSFVIWMIMRYESKILNVQQQNLIQHRLNIVSAGILGFSQDLTATTEIHEETLQQWVELTEGHFPHRQHIAAWNLFRKFLIQLDDPSIQLAKVVSQRASAKVFAKQDVQYIVEYLQSVESGISNVVLRQIIQRHFRLTSAMGVRRSESLHLRQLDIDGEMLRVRPYSNHQLKTLGSERVVPLGLLGSRIREVLQQMPKSLDKSVLTLNHEIDRPVFFNQISKIIHQVTGDQDLGLHHLRHTFASSYALKCFENIVDLSCIKKELIWINDWMPADQQFHELLGNEGQVGQGLKAVSRVLGHLHETTTLRHYVHILFLVSYAYGLQQKKPMLHTAFYQRVMSRAQLFKHYKQASQSDDMKIVLRNIIEKSVHKKQKKLWVEYVKQRETTSKKASHTRFDQFEEIENYLALGQGRSIEDLNLWKNALEHLAQIPSGKRGSSVSRHVLPVQGKMVKLPSPLKSVEEAGDTKELLNQLDMLKQKNSRTYEWLIQKWLYQSESNKLLIRYDYQDEQLIDDLDKFGLHPTRLQKGKYRYFRIMENAMTLNAVRWAMTWLAVENIKNTLK